MLSPAWNQTWTIFGLLLNLSSIGFHYGFPTVLFKSLRSKNDTISLTLEDESWITSAMGITTLLSFIIMAPIMQQYGRKITHIIYVLINMTSFILLYLAQNITTLIIARMIAGLTSGGITIVAMIIGEFTSPNNRGIFLNCKTAALCFGITLVHVFGLFFDWRIVSLIGLVMCVPSLIITLTWPESPAWLAYKGKLERSEKSFHWLRGNGESANIELEAMMQAQTRRMLSKCDVQNKSLLMKIKNILYKFTRKDFQRPAIIVAFVFLIIECSGRHVFPSYAVKFITAFIGDESQAFYYIIALDCIILLSSITSCVVVKLYDRRTLLFVTGTLSNVLLLSVCFYLYLRSHGIASKDNIWLPIGLLILYFIMINLGTTPIVLTLLGEVFPLAHKGVGAAISGVFFAISLVTTLKVTPFMIQSLDVHGTFFIFSLCMIGALLYLYFFLPETKGKTLQEIEDYFNDHPVELKHINDPK